MKLRPYRFSRGLLLFPMVLPGLLEETYLFLLGCPIGVERIVRSTVVTSFNCERNEICRWPDDGPGASVGGVVEGTSSNAGFRGTTGEGDDRSCRVYRVVRAGLLFVILVSVFLCLLCSPAVDVSVSLHGEEAKRYAKFLLGGEGLVRGDRRLGRDVGSLFFEDWYIRRKVRFRGNERERTGSFLHAFRRPTGEVRLVLVGRTFERGVEKGLGDCLTCLF